jgi:hypothetical protein
MAKVDGWTAANLELVLDEVFADVPHGGDHECRKHVAKMLIESAEKGDVTLDELRAVGRGALHQLSIRGLA